MREVGNTYFEDVFILKVYFQFTKIGYLLYLHNNNLINFVVLKCLEYIFLLFSQ